MAFSYQARIICDVFHNLVIEPPAPFISRQQNTSHDDPGLTAECQARPLLGNQSAKLSSLREKKAKKMREKGEAKEEKKEKRRERQKKGERKEREKEK